MSSAPHTVAVLSVFSPSRFEGSRVAVVAARGPFDHLPLEATRRGDLAAEFNTDSVAFLYDAPANNQPRIVDLYVRPQDDAVQASYQLRHIRWAKSGFNVNAILAAAHFLFTHVERRTAFSIIEASERSSDKQVTAFRVPASGLDVVVFFNHYRQVAGCLVPAVARLLKLDRPAIPWTKIVETQAPAKNLPEATERGCPVVGLGEQSWVLVDVSDHAEVLNSVERRGIQVDGQASGLVWFVQQKSQVGTDGEPTIEGLEIRVMHDGWEEEAGANAAVALTAWLSLNSSRDLAGQVEKLSVDDSTDGSKPSQSRRVFGVQTGARIKRPGTIAVEVDLKVDEAGKQTVDAVVVSGRANFLSVGQLIGT